MSKEQVCPGCQRRGDDLAVLEEPGYGIFCHCGGDLVTSDRCERCNVPIEELKLRRIALCAVADYVDSTDPNKEEYCLICKHVCAHSDLCQIGRALADLPQEAGIYE